MLTLHNISSYTIFIGTSLRVKSFISAYLANFVDHSNPHRSLLYLAIFFDTANPHPRNSPHRSHLYLFILFDTAKPHHFATLSTTGIYMQPPFFYTAHPQLPATLYITCMYISSSFFILPTFCLLYYGTLMACTTRYFR